MIRKRVLRKRKANQLLFHIIYEKVTSSRSPNTTNNLNGTDNWLDLLPVEMIKSVYDTVCTRNVNLSITSCSISNTHFTCINDNNCILPNVVVIYYKPGVMTLRRSTSDNSVQ